MKQPRSGLTIVEMVTLICVASLVFAVVLPAIQVQREAARNDDCRNNLIEIGVAALEYEDVNGQFPPYIGLCENVDTISDYQRQALQLPNTFSLTQLLPFVGRQDLVDRCDPIAFDMACVYLFEAGYDTFGGDWLFPFSKEQRGVSAIVFDNQVEIYRCPADVTAAAWEDLLMMNSPTNSGGTGLYVLPADDSQESVRTLTNYTSNMGAVAVTDTPLNPEFEGWHGPIRSRISESIDSIPDGASTTVLFGENIGNITFNGAPFPNSRYSAALGGACIGRPDLYSGAPDDTFGSPKGSSWLQFGSPHPDVVNILRADGSVQAFNRNIQPKTFGQMCAVADGQPVFDKN